MSPPHNYARQLQNCINAAVAIFESLRNDHRQKMIEVIKHGVVLSKRDIAFEQEGVLNPAVIEVDGIVHMLYRAVANGNKSTIGYCTFSDPLILAMRMDHPLIEAEYDYESHGVEDPRIVQVDATFFLSYCGYDGTNAFGCVATSEDLKTFKKHGVVVPQFTGDQIRTFLKGAQINSKYFQPSTGSGFVWDKNLLFFPRKLHGKLALLHRIRPGIQIAYVNCLSDLTNDYWIDYMSNFSKNIVLDPKYDHELSYIGSGCPPIETIHGWLLIYHGVSDTINGYKYVACAALLNLDDPTIEIARLPYPLFSPDREFEMEGYVDNVCFPTGAIQHKDRLFIYYGAADEHIACASVNTDQLLKELLQLKVVNQ